MITREKALQASSPLLPYVYAGLGLWVAAIAYNAWERRTEIVHWITSF